MHAYVCLSLFVLVCVCVYVCQSGEPLTGVSNLNMLRPFGGTAESASSRVFGEAFSKNSSSDSPLGVLGMSSITQSISPSFLPCYYLPPQLGASPYNLVATISPGTQASSTLSPTQCVYSSSPTVAASSAASSTLLQQPMKPPKHFGSGGGF